MYTATAITTLKSISTDAPPSAVGPAAARIVRRTGPAIPSFFLGRSRDLWIAALTPSRTEIALAA